MYYIAFYYYIHLTTNSLIIKATYIQLTTRKYNHTQFKVMPMEFYFFKDINQQVKWDLKVLFTIGYNRTGKMRIQLSIISRHLRRNNAKNPLDEFPSKGFCINRNNNTFYVFLTRLLFIITFTAFRDQT